MTVTTGAQRRIALVLVALAVLAASCGNGAQEDESDAAATDAGGATEAPATAQATETADTTTTEADTSDTAGEWDTSATITVAGPGFGTNFDPHLRAGPLDLWQLRPLYDTLIRSGPGIVLEPNLATSWEYSEDGLTLTMELRDDVTFHDGSAFDAEAVVANITRAQDLPESSAARLLTSIAGVTAVDEFTVELELSEIDASLPGVLAGPPGMIVNPAMMGDDAAFAAGASGVGTGAYTLSEVVPGDFVRFDRYEDYWDAEVLARAPAVYDYRLVPDPSARLNGLRTQVFDAVHSSGMTADLDAEAESGDAVEFNPGLGYQVNAILLHPDQAPFDSLEVRQALAQGINFPEMIDTVLSADCGLAEQVWHEGHWAHNPDLEGTRVYDPEAARQLLADAGFADGLDMDLLAAPGTSFEATGNIFQAQLAEIGVNVTLQPLLLGDATAAFLDGEYPVLLMSFLAQDDPHVQIAEQLLGWDLVGEGPEVDELMGLIADARATLDLEERTALYRDIGALIHEQAWLIPYCYPRLGYAHSSAVAGFTEEAQVLNSLDPRFIGRLADA